MNAFEFSNMRNSPVVQISTIEKNNFSNMQLLKSIYDDSFDVANNFFKEGFGSSTFFRPYRSENAIPSAKSDVAMRYAQMHKEGFKSGATKAFEQSKKAANKTANVAKKADKTVKKADAKVKDAKKKVDEAKKDAAKQVEDAKQDVEDAKKDADEAKTNAEEAKQDAADAEETAAAAEDDAAAEGDGGDGGDDGFANISDSDSDSDDGFANISDSDSDSDDGFANISDSDDDSDDGFANVSNSDDEYIEGMKNKKKSSGKKKSGSSKKGKKGSSKKKGKKYPETVPSFDLIGWAVKKAQGTKNDEKMVKNILNILFVASLSFLIAHNWYYTFFVNPTKFRLENAFSFLSENEFTHFFAIYVVQIVKSIDTFIMESIPGKFDFIIGNTPFGKRSVFYFILSVSLGTVPYFLKQLKSIFEYLRNQTNRLIHVIQNYNKSPVGLRDFIHDIISKGFNSIFSFKGNALLSGIIGVLFVTKYMGNMVIDHSKGFVENATEVIPTFFAKLLSGSIFYIIYLIFKFAIFYQPTIAFSSAIITAYLFYFSIVRLPKINGFGETFSVMSENIKHMNDGKVLFDRDLFSKFKNGVEDALRFIMENAHQIIMLFVLKNTVGNILNMNSKIAKTTFLSLGIFACLFLLFSILEKYGVGKSEVAELKTEINTLSKEIKQNIDAPPEIKSTNMFERIYKPYKSV